MTNSNSKANAKTPRSLDRPSVSIPNVDQPWDSPEEREHRRKVIGNDRSSHRVFHSLYEDMLN